MKIPVYVSTERNKINKYKYVHNVLRSVKYIYVNRVTMFSTQANTASFDIQHKYSIRRLSTVHSLELSFTKRTFTKHCEQRHF